MDGISRYLYPLRRRVVAPRAGPGLTSERLRFPRNRRARRLDLLLLVLLTPPVVGLAYALVSMSFELALLVLGVDWSSAARTGELLGGLAAAGALYLAVRDIRAVDGTEVLIFPDAVVLPEDPGRPLLFKRVQTIERQESGLIFVTTYGRAFHLDGRTWPTEAIGDALRDARGGSRIGISTG